MNPCRTCLGVLPSSKRREPRVRSNSPYVEEGRMLRKAAEPTTLLLQGFSKMHRFATEAALWGTLGAICVVKRAVGTPSVCAAGMRNCLGPSSTAYHRPYTLEYQFHDHTTHSRYFGGLVATCLMTCLKLLLLLRQNRHFRGKAQSLTTCQP